MKDQSSISKVVSVPVIAFAFLFPHYAGFPFFSYTIIVLIVIWLFLKYVTKESFKNIFFSLKHFEFKAIWFGAVAAIILSALLQYAIMPFIKKLLPDQTIDLHD